MDTVPARAGRATLAAVAASAGVSVATVSKVLNGRSDVSPATRALVQGYLKQHGYVASPRRRDTTDRPTLEVTMDAELNAYSTEIIQGVLLAAAEADAAVVVGIRADGPHGNGSGPDRSSAWASSLVAAGRRAVIAVTSELTAAHLTALARAHLPLVVIDPLDLPRARVTSIGSTNFSGGLAAT